jgi:hypothetical protein
MDPREFNRLALELSRRQEPASLRAAIGRSYYAAFNVAAEMLRRWNVPVARSAAGHGEIIRYLFNSGDAALAEVSVKLDILRKRRNVADYDLSAADVENLKSAQSTAATAKHLIDVMDQCLDPARSAKIIAAIAEYRRKIAPPSPGSA